MEFCKKCEEEVNKVDEIDGYCDDCLDLPSLEEEDQYIQDRTHPDGYVI